MIITSVIDDTIAKGRLSHTGHKLMVKELKKTNPHHYAEWRHWVGSMYRRTRRLYIPTDHGVQVCSRNDTMSMSDATYLWATFVTNGAPTPTPVHNLIAHGTPVPVTPWSSQSPREQWKEWVTRSRICYIPIKDYGVADATNDVPIDEIVDSWVMFAETATKRDYYNLTGVVRGTSPAHVNQVVSSLHRICENDWGHDLCDLITLSPVPTEVVIPLFSTFEQHRDPRKRDVMNKFWGSKQDSNPDDYYRTERRGIHMKQLLNSIHKSILTVDITNSHTAVSAALDYDNPVNQKTRDILLQNPVHAGQNFLIIRTT